MANIEQCTISLPVEQMQYIDAQVMNGVYASVSDVVQAGLLALRDRDETVESWLHEAVAPAFDAMQANPSRAIPATQVFATLRAMHAGHLASRRDT